MEGCVKGMRYDGYSVKQRLANYGLLAKVHPLPVFVNKVLLEQPHL